MHHLPASVMASVCRARRSVPARFVDLEIDPQRSGISIPCGSIEHRVGVIRNRHTGESSVTKGCSKCGFALAPHGVVGAAAGHARFDRSM